jgi:hypothetical protein
MSPDPTSHTATRSQRPSLPNNDAGVAVGGATTTCQNDSIVETSSGVFTFRPGEQTSLLPPPDVRRLPRCVAGGVVRPQGAIGAAAAPSVGAISTLNDLSLLGRERWLPSRYNSPPRAERLDSNHHHHQSGGASGSLYGGGGAIPPLGGLKAMLDQQRRAMDAAVSRSAAASVRTQVPSATASNQVSLELATPPRSPIGNGGPSEPTPAAMNERRTTPTTTTTGGVSQLRQLLNQQQGLLQSLSDGRDAYDAVVAAAARSHPIF